MYISYVLSSYLQDMKGTKKQLSLWKDGMEALAFGRTIIRHEHVRPITTPPKECTSGKKADQQLEGSGHHDNLL